jgi:hypothetical protein
VIVTTLLDDRDGGEVSLPHCFQLKIAKSRLGAAPKLSPVDDKSLLRSKPINERYGLVTSTDALSVLGSNRKDED